MTTIWYGQAGHFCDAQRCGWHLHTHVQNNYTGKWWCISSVGEYLVDKDGPFESLRGLGKDEKPVIYETVVFAEDGDSFSHEEGETLLCREGRDEAVRNHMAMVDKYKVGFV